MKRNTRRTFSAEFKLESAQLVLDQHYSIREAATAVGVGLSTMDRWVRQFAKNVTVKRLKLQQWPQSTSPLSPCLVQNRYNELTGRFSCRQLL